jgi:hypothetical protein
VRFGSKYRHKKRQLNADAKVLYLKLLRNHRMRRAFPLYHDRDIFKTSSKECYEMLTSNLIEHKRDDDYDTDIDVVDDHVDMCLKELKETIENFILGDPLKLCRNARGEFSGI